MNRTALTALCLLVLSFACSDDSPTDEERMPELKPASSTLTIAYGDSARLAFTAGGATVAGVQLAVVTESRVLPEYPVLSGASLAAGVFRATGGGRATVEATAPGTKSTRVEVIVTAGSPVIVAFTAAGKKVSAGETLTLYGYGLDRAGSVTVDGLPVTIEARDSASIRFRAPVHTASDTSDCRGSSRHAVSVAGAQMKVPDHFAVQRAGELVLAPGELRYLERSEAACIRFGWAGQEARYMLAALDVRSIERAQRGAQRPFWADTFWVTHSDRSHAGITSALARQHPQRVVRRGLTARPAGAARASLVAERLREGDVFDALTYRFINGAVIPSYVPARVLRAYGDYLVLAIPIGRTIDARELASLDTAAAYLNGAGVAALEAMFKLARPVTIRETGQLTILLDSQLVQPMVWSYDERGPISAVVLMPFPETEETRTANRLRAMAHGLTGAFQWLHWSQAYPGGEWRIPTDLAQDGGMYLVSWELQRRFRGEPLEGQKGLPQHGAVRNLNAIFGQYGSELMLNWFVRQRIASGEGIDDAFGAVVVGLLNGLYGYDEYGFFNGDGLSQRMKARLGQNWDVVREGLRYGLIAGGADDMTSNPLLQDDRWYQMSLFIPPPRITTGTGASVTPTGDSWSSVMAPDEVSRVFFIDSIGGTIRNAPSRPDLAWAIARMY